MMLPGLDAGSVTLTPAAGLVAAVNPCGFALLPIYLSLFVLGDAPPSRTVAVGRALRATAALTLGFTLVFVAFGLAIAPVAASVQSYLPAFTVLLGVSLALVGLWLLSGRELPTLPLPGRRRSGRGPVVTSFRSGSLLAGVVLFAAYAAGMGLAVGVAATSVALALAGAGAYVAWYGAWELRVLHGGVGADPVVSAAAEVQQWLASLADSVGVVGLALALAALVAVALVPWRRMARTRSSGVSGDEL